MSSRWNFFMHQRSVRKKKHILHRKLRNYELKLFNGLGHRAVDQNILCLQHLHRSFPNTHLINHGLVTIPQIEIINSRKTDQNCSAQTPWREFRPADHRPLNKELDHSIPIEYHLLLNFFPFFGYSLVWYKKTNLIHLKVMLWSGAQKTRQEERPKTERRNVEKRLDAGREKQMYTSSWFYYLFFNSTFYKFYLTSTTHQFGAFRDKLRTVDLISRRSHQFSLSAIKSRLRSKSLH